MTNPTWGSNGKRIPYPELSDDHLKNIIHDGYRNPHLIEEAKRRGFDVPQRPIDGLTHRQLIMWLESFASCALSGNKLGQEMTRLYEEDKALFFLKLNRFLEDNEKPL